MEPTIISVVTLNQQALDFQGNKDRIIESIVNAKREHHAKIRVGPELEISGLSCEDHFLEPDTNYHSWQVLRDVLRLTSLPPYDDILCAIGMPVAHRGVNYNCAVFVYGGKIYLIKPKTVLGDDGNFYESRRFTAWKGDTNTMQFSLPGLIQEVNGQTWTTFGNALLCTADGYYIGAEIGDELWSPLPESTKMFLQGTHIICNLSASHFNLRKLSERKYLVNSTTTKTGGVYVYSNLRGCDGSRMFFDGSSMVSMNGKILCYSKQFLLKDVDIQSARVDLSEIMSYRFPRPSRATQSEESIQTAYHIVHVPDLRLIVQDVQNLSTPVDIPILSVEEEIAYAPAAYLWDYLRLSNAKGYFLPISGGSDSTSSLILIYIMCDLVLQSLKESIGFNKAVIEENLISIVGKVPESVQEMFSKVMFTAHLGTQNNSAHTTDLASRVAAELGSTHYSSTIDEIVGAFSSAVVESLDIPAPRFKVHKGSEREDVALQNVQARSRMALSYLLAQLVPWTQGIDGYLLVLGTCNLEESLSGYITKYDTSSADINPLGGISKVDLRRFLSWAADHYNFPTLREVLQSVPTAELQPLAEGELAQTDEDQLGMTYEQASLMGRLRREEHCGPLFMFRRLCSEWDLPFEKVAELVKRFFTMYSKNRHKATILTPAVHIENYTADDNRFDPRPFLYNTNWDVQFRAIDQIVEQHAVVEYKVQLRKI